ncbi:hypothetical protein FQN52_008511 [Onygenales sp. PD_12]|nr:hypothetical protein FQN52_008511 [Onygenales sp. PD_12]KAK2786800.1 hypothetical protein FQN53_006097 [Emmonsiellopsis sp. PD_33]KAK2800859.1 hypothetical protein FQN51_005794 [Onygenales sp. PD_10]
MTGEKRSRDSPPDPTSRKKQAHGAVHFGDDDDDAAGPSSSQAALEQPEGSAQPPAPKRAKHPRLSDIVPEEKSEWRQCETVKALFELRGWNSQDFLDKLEQRFELDSLPFSTWLIKVARTDLREIQSQVRNSVCGAAGDKIRWTKLVLESVPLSDSQENDLIFTWIKVKEINYLLPGDRDHLEKYAGLLADLLSPPDGEVSAKTIKAFYGEEAVNLKRATTKPKGQ